ncbi:MAG: TadE/TadG family type IV pilus assembly protein [Pikeienuella sp.]
MLRSIRGYWACERGAAGAEFVIMLPLGLMVLIIAAEYGEGLIMRERLDSSLRDAIRILSRAPLDVDVSGNPKLYADFETVAKAIIADRTGRDIGEVAFEAAATRVSVAPTDTLRTELITIQARAAINLDLGLLSFFQYFIKDELPPGSPPGTAADSPIETLLVMRAFDRARWVGERPPGTTACPQADRDAGLCGGPDS